jgi:NAD(P)-dependent dehydrogenase (short-subunit alcohol dehydrogenase family)
MPLRSSPGPIFTHRSKTTNQTNQTQCEALRPVLLDVTKEEQVLALAAQVDKENPHGIFALVNNAGMVDFVCVCVCVCAVCVCRVCWVCWRSTTPVYRFFSLPSRRLGGPFDQMINSTPSFLHIHTYKNAFNTTGVSRAGLIDWLNVQDFRFVMEVRERGYLVSICFLGFIVINGIGRT